MNMDIRWFMNELNEKSPLIDDVGFLMEKEVNRCSIVGKIACLCDCENEGCYVLLIKTVGKDTLELKDSLRVVLLKNYIDIGLKNSEIIGFIDPYIVNNLYNGVKSIVNQREFILFRNRLEQRAEELAENSEVLSQNGSSSSDSEETKPSKRRRMTLPVIPIKPSVNVDQNNSDQNDSDQNDSDQNNSDQNNSDQNNPAPTTTLTEDDRANVISSEIVYDVSDDSSVSSTVELTELLNEVNGMVSDKVNNSSTDSPLLTCSDSTEQLINEAAEILLSDIVNNASEEISPSTSDKPNEKPNSSANVNSSDVVYTIEDSPLSPTSSYDELHGSTSAPSLSETSETTDLRIENSHKALRSLLMDHFISTMNFYLYGRISQSTILRLISDEVAHGFCSNCLKVYNYTQFKCIRKENSITRIPYCPDCPDSDKLKIFFFSPLRIEAEGNAPVDIFFFSDNRNNFFGIDPEEYSNNNEVRGKYRWDVMKKLGEKEGMIGCDLRQVENDDYVVPLFTEIHARFFN